MRTSLTQPQQRVVDALVEFGGSIDVVLSRAGIVQSAYCTFGDGVSECVPAPIVQALIRKGALVKEARAYADDELPPFGTRFVLAGGR
jgi:hypothetical protein